MKRIFALAFFAATAACGGRGPMPLGYAVPEPSTVSYIHADTTLVEANVMGQRMEIAMRAEATYALAFDNGSDGVEVRLTVERMDGSLAMPMSAPQTIDGEGIDGALVFTLDAMGNARIVEAPRVPAAAARMLSAATTAHTFFPGLPNRVVAVGEQWVDTVSYEADAELGDVTERSVMTYTVLGRTTFEGLDVLEIGLTGTSELANEMDMDGMSIAQSSTVQIEGRILWDDVRGLMVAAERTGTGEGTVRVPMLPQPLPITLRVKQRTRLAN